MKVYGPRVIALGVVQQDDRILVAESVDLKTGGVFYRPLGGTVEFGETGEETVSREFSEEIGQAVTNIRYLGTIENLFTHQGCLGHEIALIYRVDFIDPEAYEYRTISRLDDDPDSKCALWRFLSDLEREDVPLYPGGLLELLQQPDSGQRLFGKELDISSSQHPARSVFVDIV